MAPAHGALPPCGSAQPTQGQILGRRKRVSQESGLPAVGTRAGPRGGRALRGLDSLSVGAVCFHFILASCKISSSQTNRDAAWIWVPKAVAFNNSASQPAQLVPHGAPSSLALVMGSRAAVMPGPCPGSGVHPAHSSGRDGAQAQHRSAADACALTFCRASPGSRCAEGSMAGSAPESVRSRQLRGGSWQGATNHTSQVLF